MSYSVPPEVSAELDMLAYLICNGYTRRDALKFIRFGTSRG